ncbi:hypothetical protein BDC45DRAFT_219948 [Circinella umbellata]|nr:hypothetical protein BDC45DRAFT_219948 [Circinella umbellata]
MKVLGVVGINKKSFKYPTSTVARGTSLQDNNAKHTECVFANESLMITETNDITKRVSVKVLRLPEPPKLTPIRMPSHLQRRNTIRRSSKVRPSSETRRLVQQRILKNQTQKDNLLKIPEAHQHQQQKFAERQEKQSMKTTNHQEDYNNSNNNYNYSNNKNEFICNNVSNISTEGSNSHYVNVLPTKRQHHFHHLHYIHPESDIFMPAVTQALLNERSNTVASITEKTAVAPSSTTPDKKIVVVQQDSTPSSISYSCSYYSSSSISTSLTTPQHPPPPPPPSFTSPSLPHHYDHKQRNYTADNSNDGNKIGYMLRWISSRVQNAFIKKDNRCSPIYLNSNHIYNNSNFSSHINVSCPTIVVPDNKNDSNDHHDDDDENSFILRRPSPIFLDSTITV